MRRLMASQMSRHTHATEGAIAKQKITATRLRGKVTLDSDFHSRDRGGKDFSFPAQCGARGVLGLIVVDPRWESRPQEEAWTLTSARRRFAYVYGRVTTWPEDGLATRDSNAYHHTCCPGTRADESGCLYGHPVAPNQPTRSHISTHPVSYTHLTLPTILRV